MLYIKDNEGNLKEITVTAATATDAAKVTYKDGSVDDELNRINELISAHLSSISNPHKVTKDQLGLANVVNTADSAVPIKGGLTKFTTGGAYTELSKKLDNTTSTDNAGKAVIVGSDGSLVFGTAGVDSSAVQKQIDASVASEASAREKADADLRSSISTKQDKLTAGSNISIDNNNRISATNTTYNVMTASSDSAAGSAGLVPAPPKGSQAKVLHGDATWTDSVTNASSLKDSAHSWGATELYNELRYSGASPRNVTSTKVYASAKSDEAAKLGTKTVGGSTNPIYLSSGAATAMSSTVGSAIEPVYLSGGSITKANTMVDTSTNQTITGAKTFSGGAVVSGRLNIPTKAPASPVDGDIWIE